MTARIAGLSVLTPADVSGQLQAHGLDALGLTVPMLSATWGSSTPSTMADDTLDITVPGLVAPFTGTFERLATTPTYSGPSGTAYSTPAGVLALHPEAVHRLEQLVRARLGRLDRPVPVAMLVHPVTVPARPLMEWFRAGDPMGVAGQLTFHDRRGLVIDPVAVAGLFADLLGAFPGLSAAPLPAGALAGPGGVGAIAAIGGPAVRVHAVDPHGAAYRPRRAGSELQVLDAAGATVSQVPDTGLVDLAAGQQVGRPPVAAGSPPSQVLWGASPAGQLADTPWQPAALPAGVSLPRQFLRVMALDLDWHLLGNRGYVTDDPALPTEDDMPANGPLPVVRRALAGPAYLVDGNDVLGAIGQELAAHVSGPAFLVSPVIDATLAVPAARGNASRWPQLPPGTQSPADTALVRTYAAAGTAAPTATWLVPPAGQPAHDVVVTLPAGSLPPQTSVRVFPRTFRMIRGIGEDPSFVRGDGASAVVTGAGPTELTVLNPFALAAADPVPSPAVLSLDLVAVARDGTRRMVSRVDLTVGAQQPRTTPAPTFGGAVPLLVPPMLALEGLTSIAPAEVFGTPPSPTGPTGAHPALSAPVIDWVRWLTNESGTSRVGPHLPTQARFDTVLALDDTSVAGARTWRAVLSGAWYAEESRCSQPTLGDPGNPPGPDLHASGIRVGGQLAHDLGLHALKRCQSMLPFGVARAGWLALAGSGTDYVPPPPDPVPAAGTPYLAGAVLETVAPVTDTPELSFADVPPDSATLQSVVDDVVTSLGGTPGSVTVAPAQEPVVRRLLQREIATARRGQRDAMWAIARAVRQAREYVYVESPAFQRTARGAGADGREGSVVDLVSVLRDRLVENPRLKVLVCLPRLPDVATANEAWVRAAFRDRNEAIGMLTGALGGRGLDRVAAFHPAGFPGRPTLGRGTVVLVDDVWAMVGTSHWRRRGMTFDGGCDVVTVDRRLDDRGVGATLAAYRQQLLATRLGLSPDFAASLPVPPGGTRPDPTDVALWTRLAEPESAFDAIRDLLAGGGLGRVRAVYAGPTDTAVIPRPVDATDPNGVTGLDLPTLLAGLF